MKENVLFTSAGDNTFFYNLWCKSDRNYDIFICYYGDDKKNKYEEYSDVYLKRKSGKMQNFYYMWINNISHIQNYKNYYIVDDDIIIETYEINELFKLLSELNVWILQPSFNEKSQVSHEITKQNKECKYRYTNFIEINTPFFSHYAITEFMKVYNPILVGYGCDILFINCLGLNKEDKYVIVDYISCINPLRKVREIDKLESLSKRINNWNNIKTKLKIKNIIHKNFSIVK
jgi:hypothetical protein